MDVDEPIKWLPLRFMETVGLECAVWPHLYWETQMTETFVRSQDARRQERARANRRRRCDEEDEEDRYLQAEEAGELLTDEQVAKTRKITHFVKPSANFSCRTFFESILCFMFSRLNFVFKALSRT